MSEAPAQSPFAPMNLAVVIEQFDPAGGGAERSTAQIIEQLVARGHTVTLITGASPDGVTLPGARIVRLSARHAPGPLRLWRFSTWAIRQLKRGRFDASLSVTTAVPATVLEPRSGTLRETFERNIAMRPSAASRFIKRALTLVSVKRQLLLALERRTLRHPSVGRIIAVSRYVSDQLADYNVSADRVEIIANAAAMPQLAVQERARARQVIREGLRISAQTPVYLFVAQNPRLKGIDTLLRALQKLKAENFDAVALLVGLPSFGVQQQAVGLGVRDRVRIVGASNRMAQLYSAADVTVLPTWYDPSSKVVIESLMMGVPAITTAFNGAADFVTGEGGSPRGRVIADPGDAAGLARAMRELADPGERARCSATMAGLADELSMRRHVDRLEAVLATAAREAKQAAAVAPASGD